MPYLRLEMVALDVRTWGFLDGLSSDVLRSHPLPALSTEGTLTWVADPLTWNLRFSIY